MYVFDEFEGDDNKVLKDIQHDLYSNSVSIIYSKLKDSYLKSCDIVSVKNDAYHFLYSNKFFDHRILQDVHDLIAAYYRLCKSNINLSLLTDDKITIEFFKNDWNNFLIYEVDKMSRCPDVVQAFVIVVTNPNNDTGMLGESMLAYHLIDRYGTWFANVCKRFVRKSTSWLNSLPNP